MNTHSLRFIPAVTGALLVAAMLTAPAAQAFPTYTVTSASCSGTGSLQAAIAAANAHSGADSIDIQVDINDLYVGNCSGTSVPGNIWAMQITDSVTIIGNGHTLSGIPTWVASDGTLNPNGSCPTKVSGTVLLDTTAAAFEVGVTNADNSAINVTISDLTVAGANSLLLINDNASVTLDNVHAQGLTDPFCVRSSIESQTGANLTITNSSFDRGINWDSAINGIGASLILGGPGNLTVASTTFTTNNYPGAITWTVSGGKTANIVSSQLSESGGVYMVGAGTANLVNSIVNMGVLGSRTVIDRVVADTGAVLNVKATTIKASGPKCNTDPILGGCSVTPNGFIVATDGAALNLVQSAVGVGITDDTVASAVIAGTDGGTLTADTQTWVLPVAQQNAAALQTIFGQPSLLTTPPGLPTVSDPGFFDYPATVTPMIGSPGALLDIIDNATCTSGTDANKLINPIDSSCITMDALGNSRWDTGNNRRNIGAVQLTLAPHLTFVGVGSGYLDLSWSRPSDPSNIVAVTGYSVVCTPQPSGTPITVAFAGATTLSGRITGVANGVTYDCTVAATSTDGTGPTSNTVTATPLGSVGKPIPTAKPGSLQVSLSWTASSAAGHSGSPTYTVLYRPRGTTTWIPGPSGIIGRTTVIPGLTNGTTYQLGVFATWPDGTVSRLGMTVATPVGTLPLTVSALSTGAHPKRGHASTLVKSSSTSSYGTVVRSVRCTPANVATTGDLTYCTYAIASGGSVTVTPRFYRPIRIVVTLQAVPKSGVKGWRASAIWTRTWTSR